MRIAILIVVVLALCAPVVVSAQPSECEGRVTMRLWGPLNVRDGIWGQWVGFVWRGAGVNIYGHGFDVTGATWYRIRWGDGHYWVHGDYVDIETPGGCYEH